MGAVLPLRSDVEAARLLVRLVERRGGVPPEWAINLAMSVHTQLPPDQHELFITFGQRYYREPHEQGHTWVHPDGWLTVQFTVTEDGFAMCRERARVAAWHYLGGHYAFDYETADPEMYPRGELARMVLP